MGILRVGKECEMTNDKKHYFESLEWGEVVRVQMGNKLWQERTKFKMKIK